jgi:hypothetical protein
MASVHGAILLFAICSASAVTPVEKVVQLLKGLQSKVQKEGQDEAVQYEHYETFCKNQAKYKTAAIQRATERTQFLDAEILDSDAKIADMSTALGDLNSQVATLQQQVTSETADRTLRHAEYLKNAKELDESIASCAEAVSKLRSAKSSISGGQSSLMALATATTKVKLVKSHSATQDALALLKSMVQDKKPGDAPKYAFSSNDIIASIAALQATFKEKRAALEMDEMNDRTASEKKVLGDTNSIEFNNKEIVQSKLAVSSETEVKMDNSNARDSASNAEKSDTIFLEDLKSSCEQKAQDWEQRSTSRANEIAAIGTALASLENGSLSKKAVSLVKLPSKDLIKIGAGLASRTKPSLEPGINIGKAAVSFVQIQNVRNSEAIVVQRLLTHLDTAAKHLRSPVLAAVALKVQLKADNFKNVRKIISQLIAKLEADAASEKTTKSFCDENMKEAIASRDQASLNIEKESGIVAEQTAKVSELAKNIAELTTDIIDSNKGKLEAAKNREAEKANNEESLQTAQGGVEAVDIAVASLQAYYTPSLLQASITAAKARQTPGDVAPKVFEGEYTGQGDSAKGVLGMLEVIKADCERAAVESAQKEKEAAEEYEKFLADTAKDIETKAQSKSDAETAKETAEGNIVQAKNDLADAETLLDSAAAQLTKLAPMCVDEGETYEQRVAGRKEEMASLKEATKIINQFSQ